MARGWAACLVSAADGDDDTDTLDLGPHEASRLARRAWPLSRVLDALATRPEVDSARVVLAGHSRNGRAVLIAAGFADRFAAVRLLWCAPLCRATGWRPGCEHAVPLPVLLARAGWAVALP